jgi:hypothetical protein
MTADEKMKIMMKQIQDEIKAHAAWKESQSGLRDQFAMAALPAVMDKVGGFRPMVHAEDAYHMADAMLEARKDKS